VAELSKSQSISISLHESSQPLLSIIITSYTTEGLGDIYELLDSIKEQIYPNIETIFVAERSRELYERVKEYGEEIFRDSVEPGRDSVEIKSPNLNEAQQISKNPSFKVLFNDGETGLSAARNLGIKEAKGDIIAFVDDDALPFPDWAEEMVKTYNDGSIIGVTGPAFPLWEDESVASWFPEEFYWIFSCTAWCDLKGLQEVRNVWGMNMSFKREAFERCGLFTTTFGLREGKGAVAEEDDLSLRIRRQTGKRILYNPRLRIKHRVYKHRLTWNFIARRSYEIGRSRRTLKKLGSQDDKNTFSLKVESQLLKRILSRLLPTILKDLFKNPLIAWRKFSITFIVLSSVALGYMFPSLGSVRR